MSGTCDNNGTVHPDDEGVSGRNTLGSAAAEARSSQTVTVLRHDTGGAVPSPLVEERVVCRTSSSVRWFGSGIPSTLHEHATRVLPTARCGGPLLAEPEKDLAESAQWGL